MSAHDAGFEAALALARCVAQGRHGSSACLCASVQRDKGEDDGLFHLSPSSYQSLLGRLRSEPFFGLNPNLDFVLDLADSNPEPEFNVDKDPEFLLGKLQIEYDPDDGLLSFKMSESRIHSAFAAQVSHRITTATCPFLPGFQALGAPNITLASSSSIENDKVGGNRYPDISWGRLCLETNPPVVAKVAYSHPPKLAQLQQRCEGFLKGTRGLRQVRTVIAFNIYNPAAPSDYEAIMRHLDQCYVGVYCGHNVGLDELSNIRIPFSDLRDFLRAAVQNAIRDRDTPEDDTPKDDTPEDEDQQDEDQKDTNSCIRAPPVEFNGR
ncbi:hypothetical protein CI238_12520 [Colletotrichum incanum]|uniref:Uncharacterized protein n=1 Tax=Colletotrichum incanum TaxID=1573173 RepID=A0A167BAY3_COLIC|nr:hypothetical protein CI238_12520 [Colletotrichum incanum]